jgi:hypothetical protein
VIAPPGSGARACEAPTLADALTLALSAPATRRPQAVA